MEKPANRSYRLRGTRMTDGQELAYNKFWEKFSIPTIGEIQLKEYFPNSNAVIMEIGTGMGEATAQIAKLFPEIGFIGVELHKPGLGALLYKIDEYQLTNLRLMSEDARILLEENFPDESFDAFHLYFPDPWPKVRHRKRRIVQEDFIKLIHRKLKPGGYIHIATDWVEYADWIKKKFEESHLFAGGQIDRPNFRPVSKFEGQGIRKGHRVTDLKYFKA
jgi:tRNA (guanine-N7-)-methyltransferase